MTNDAKVKKWLPNNVQMQCTGSKIWSRDDAEDGTIKPYGKTSERSKLMPHSTIWSHKMPFKKTCVPHRSSQLNDRTSKRLRFYLKGIWRCDFRLVQWTTERLQGDPQSFWENYVRIHIIGLNQKSQTVQNEKRHLDPPPHSTGRKLAKKPTQIQTSTTTVREKEG